MTSKTAAEGRHEGHILEISTEEFEDGFGERNFCLTCGIPFPPTATRARYYMERAILKEVEEESAWRMARGAGAVTSACAAGQGAEADQHE